MENEVNHDCNTCIHGYFADFDSSGWHSLCGAGYCYLCHQSKGGECNDYEEGDTPENVDPM